jgi:hypothetical protein
MIAASDIVKKLRIGQNMRDLMTKTNLVMMAEPGKFVGTEKGKNPVQFELTTNATIGLSAAFFSNSALCISCSNLLPDCRLVSRMAIKLHFSAHRSAAGDTAGARLHKDLGQTDH